MRDEQTAAWRTILANIGMIDDGDVDLLCRAGRYLSRPYVGDVAYMNNYKPFYRPCLTNMEPGPWGKEYMRDFNG